MGPRYQEGRGWLRDVVSVECGLKRSPRPLKVGPAQTESPCYRAQRAEDEENDLEGNAPAECSGAFRCAALGGVMLCSLLSCFDLLQSRLRDRQMMPESSALFGKNCRLVAGGQ